MKNLPLRALISSLTAFLPRRSTRPERTLPQTEEVVIYLAPSGASANPGKAEGAEALRAAAALDVAEALGLVTRASFLALRAATGLPHKTILVALLDLGAAGLITFDSRPTVTLGTTAYYAALTPEGRQALIECRIVAKEAPRSAESRFVARCFGDAAS